MRNWCLDFIYLIFRQVTCARLVFKYHLLHMQGHFIRGIDVYIPLPHNQVNCIRGTDAFVHLPHMLVHCIRGNGA